MILPYSYYDDYCKLFARCWPDLLAPLLLGFREKLGHCLGFTHTCIHTYIHAIYTPLRSPDTRASHIFWALEGRENFRGYPDISLHLVQHISEYNAASIELDGFLSPGLELGTQVRGNTTRTTVKATKPWSPTRAQTTRDEMHVPLDWGKDAPRAHAHTHTLSLYIYQYTHDLNSM